MPPPALSIPVRARIDDFKKGMDDMKSHAGTAVRQVAKQFADLNSGIELGATHAATRWGLSFAKGAAAIYIAFKVASTAIAAAREQIAEMVAIADKAGRVNVGGNFFQRFTSEAQKLKVSAEDLEGALSHAFNATKDKSPIDLGEWDTGKERITDVEKALRVFNYELAKAAGTKLEGLVLFRNADNQEKKVMAVLTAMRELDAIGQHAASLDLGEKMFGSAFVDRIRQGKTSAESMLDSMRKASEAGSGVFSDSMIARAKEIDEQLQRAQQHLDREMKPSWEHLANTLLDVKRLWGEIIDVIANGVGVVNRFVNATDIAIKKDELKNVEAAIEKGTGLLGLPQTNMFADLFGYKRPQDALKDRAAKLRQDIAEMEGTAGGEQYGPPKPTRGEGAKLERRSTDTGETRDRFDTSADAIAKRTAALEAEAATIDLGTAARERSKIAAQLEAVAVQVNTAAGKENTAVTDEQRAKIEKIADAYGKAAEKIERARSPLATFARESQNVEKQLNAFGASALNSVTDNLVDAAMGTKTLAEAFKSMADSIIRDLLRIAIQKAITGPIASALMGGGGGGGLLGGLLGGAKVASARGNVFDHGNVVPFAKGGVITKPIVFPFAKGTAIAGEAGPEAIMPLARDASGRLGVRGGGGGPTTINQTINVIDQTTNGGNRIETRKSSDGMSLDVIVRDKVGPALAGEMSANRGPMKDAVRAAATNRNMIG